MRRLAPTSSDDEPGFTAGRTRPRDASRVRRVAGEIVRGREQREQRLEDAAPGGPVTRLDETRRRTECRSSSVSSKRHHGARLRGHAWSEAGAREFDGLLKYPCRASPRARGRSRARMLAPTLRRDRHGPSIEAERDRSGRGASGDAASRLARDLACSADIGAIASACRRAARRSSRSTRGVWRTSGPCVERPSKSTRG